VWVCSSAPPPDVTRGVCGCLQFGSAAGCEAGLAPPEGLKKERALPFTQTEQELTLRLALSPHVTTEYLMAHRFFISQDSPALYITIVTKDRLPVFRTEKMKQVLCHAINEARQSAKILLFAYVIMIDHLHLLTSRPSTTSDVLRVVKGLTARRVIDYLTTNGHASSLTKLRHQTQKRKHEYSLWQVEKNVLPVFSEGMFMEKVHYIHQNPVRGGLAERAIDYQWSSARIWQGCSVEAEPLLMDKDQIYWRRSIRAR
jgi:putative transposase